MTLLEFITTHWFGVLTVVVWPIFWAFLAATFVKRSEFIKTTEQLKTLEGRVDQLPTARDFANLQNMVTRLEGLIGVLSTDVRGVASTTDKLLQIQLGREGKK